MKILLQKVVGIILKLISSIEEQISQSATDAREKKAIIDGLAKLLPMILKIEKIGSLSDEVKIDENDLKIISSFLEKNQKMVAREGFEPPTNGL